MTVRRMVGDTVLDAHIRRPTWLWNSPLCFDLVVPYFTAIAAQTNSIIPNMIGLDARLVICKIVIYLTVAHPSRHRCRLLPSPTGVGDSDDQ